MRYEYLLRSDLELEDPDGWLPEAVRDSVAPWPVRFWFGAWDADVLCGFARGTVVIGTPVEVVAGTSRPARVTDRRP